MYLRQMFHSMPIRAKMRPLLWLKHRCHYHAVFKTMHWKQLSWCQLCRHWQHSSLLIWQPAMPPVTSKLTSCQLNFQGIIGPYSRADPRCAPSQWESSFQSNVISPWLGANLESALIFYWELAAIHIWDQCIDRWNLACYCLTSRNVGYLA